MEKEIYIHVGAPRTGTSYLRNNVFPFIDNVYFQNKTKFDHDEAPPILNCFSKIGHTGDGDELSELPELSLENALSQVLEKKILISEEHIIWSIYHMMGNIGSRALMLKKFCPNAKIIITIRRQPEYFVSLYKYFKIIDATHLGRQMRHIENMLNVNLYIDQIRMYSKYFIPFGFELVCQYDLNDISDYYFKRKWRHFIAADLSWHKLYEIYKDLFGANNILVLPQEMILEEPDYVLELFSSFFGEKIIPPNDFNTRRDNSSSRINSPFKTKEHESLFKNFILELCRTSNKKLDDCLKDISLEKYKYYGNIEEKNLKKIVGIKTHNKSLLNRKYAKWLNFIINNFLRLGIISTFWVICLKIINISKINAKLSLKYLYRKTMFLTDTFCKVDFEEMVPKDELGVNLNEDAVEQYECTKLFEIKRIFRKIAFPPDSVAIDFGSGKGKMLYFFSKQKNIKKVYGIEISEKLVNIANYNMAKLRIDNVEIYHLNAAETQSHILDECNIFYFYNPFPMKVFKAVLQQIELSLIRHNRCAYLLYFNPVYAKIIDHSSMFEKHAVYSNIISFAKTFVYRSIYSAKSEWSRY